jgi:hypothetical protein
MLQNINQKKREIKYTDPKLVGSISAEYYKNALKQKDDKQRELFIQKAKDWDRRKYGVKKAGKEAASFYKKAVNYALNGDLVNGGAYIQKAKLAAEREERRYRKGLTIKMAEYDQILAHELLESAVEGAIKDYEKIEFYNEHSAKVSSCCKIISRAEVPLVHKATFEKEVKTTYRGHHCGALLCPNCEKRKADRNFKVAYNDIKALNSLVPNHLVAYFVFTVPNCYIYDLPSEQRAIIQAAQKFIKGLGKEEVLYWIIRFENTPGKEVDKYGKRLKMRAHPHVNVIAVLRADYDRTKLKHSEVLRRFRIADGYDPNIKDVYVELDIPDEELHEMIKYTTKSSDILNEGYEYYAEVLEYGKNTKGSKKFLRGGSMIKEINAKVKEMGTADEEADIMVVVPFIEYEWKKKQYVEMGKSWAPVKLSLVCDTREYYVDPDFGLITYRRKIAVFDSS